MPAMHHTNSRSIYGTFTDIDTSYVAGHPRHTQAERPPRRRLPFEQSFRALRSCRRLTYLGRAMANAGQTMDYANEPRLVFASKLGSWHLSRMPLAWVSRPCSCISVVTPDKPALTHKHGPGARQLLTKDRLSHHYAITHEISFVMRQKKYVIQAQTLLQITAHMSNAATAQATSTRTLIGELSGPAAPTPMRPGRMRLSFV
jgi:hypothetical protein